MIHCIGSFQIGLLICKVEEWDIRFCFFDADEAVNLCAFDNTAFEVGDKITAKTDVS